MDNRAFNVLFISVFSTMIGLGVVVPLLPFYAESLGATGIWIGAIFSGFSLSRAIFMPIIGKLSDKKGRKIFIVVGLVTYTILSLAYILANSVYTLTVVRIIHGAASAMVIPVAMAYIADISPEGEEGRYMGTFMISLLLGMGLGPLLGGILKDLFGMNFVFLTMALFSATSLTICLLFLPESRYRKSEASTLKQILKSGIMKAIIFFRIMNAYSQGTFIVFLPLVASAYGLSSGQTGLLISASLLTSAFSQRFFGRVADVYNKTLLILTGSLLIAVTLIIIPNTNGFSYLILASLLFGIGNAIALPSAAALVTIAGRELGQGSAMGAFNTAMSIGMITAPVISGAIMDFIGLHFVFIFSGIVCLISLLLFWILISNVEITSH